MAYYDLRKKVIDILVRLNVLIKIGIGVISSIPESLALEGVNAVRWGSILISVVILSMAILFIYFFSNTISNPLRLLSNAAKKIIDGEYNHHLQVKTTDEVGELTNVFNIMTHGLQEREKLKGALDKICKRRGCKPSTSRRNQVRGRKKRSNGSFHGYP